MDERMLTPQEAAKALKVSDQTIYRYIRSGMISASSKPHGLFRKTYLISEGEIERLRQKAKEMGNDIPRLVAA